MIMRGYTLYLYICTMVYRNTSISTISAIFNVPATPIPWIVFPTSDGYEGILPARPKVFAVGEIESSALPLVPFADGNLP
jgi:hypothetical protein